MTNLNFSPPIIAHRGASGYAPENTLAAFIKAVQLGIKWVEFDVMEDKNGLPIIFHDELLDRITNGKGPVHNFPYAYLKTLDSGKWFSSRFSGECILTFENCVRFLNDMHMNMNIELKSLAGHEERLVNTILPIILPFLEKTNNRFLFSSFSVKTLYALRRYLPNCQIGLLLHEWADGWQKIAKELDCVSVHVNEEITTEASVKEIRNMHKAVLCYTVNQAQRAKTLFDWGVSAVFSDYPDRLSKI